MIQMLFFCVPGEELLHSALQHSDHTDLWSEEGEGRALQKEQVCCVSSSNLYVCCCASVQNETEEDESAVISRPFVKIIMVGGAEKLHQAHVYCYLNAYEKGSSDTCRRS